MQKVSPDLRGRLKTAAGLQLMSKSRRKEGLESMKYTVDNTEKSKVVKSREKSGEKLKDLKLTVKNEDVPTKKKKVSPKSKAPPVAPARMAQEGESFYVDCCLYTIFLLTKYSLVDCIWSIKR